jgi:tetratricopeptide (TPR) repeat protein
VLVAGGFTIGLMRQLQHTRYERDRAETVKNLLIEVFSAAGPGTVEEREPTAREVLDRGFQRVRAGLEDQPEVKAELLHAMGQVYLNLGRLEEAAAAHEQALELRRPRREAAPLEYAQSLGLLARIYLARNELERAEVANREAWTVTVAEVGEQDPRAIAYLDGLQSALSRMGRLGEAEGVARRVLELTLKRLGFTTVESVLEGGDQAPELVAVATTLGSLGTNQRQLGRYLDAERSFQQALVLSRRLLGERHYSVAFMLNNLANLHAAQERYELALAEMGEALAIAEAVLGSEHPSVASMRLNLGIVLDRLDRLDEALECSSRARQVFAATLGPGHPTTALAKSYTGRVEAGLGHHDSGLALSSDGLNLLRQAHGEEHPDVARGWQVLAQVYLISGRHAEALEHYQKALAVFETALGPQHPVTIECRSLTAEPLLALGRYADTRELLEPVLPVLTGRGDLVRLLARVRFQLARALAGVDAPSPEAERLAEQALASYQEIGDQAHAVEVKAWLESF